eukprot:PITA_04282
MNNQESMGSIKLPIFDGSNFVSWKIRTTTYLQSLRIDVWEIMEEGYTFPTTIPTDTLTSAKEIWDKIVLSYEGDSQIKRAKLQTLRIQYETLKMHSDEIIASYFSHIDEVVNCMKNLGEETKEVTLVKKVLRSLSAKFESKVSTIEEE